jgi:hypothetical protein
METDTFIRRWASASGSELANYQIFAGDLCALLVIFATYLLMTIVP